MMNPLNLGNIAGQIRKRINFNYAELYVLKEKLMRLAIFFFLTAAIIPVSYAETTSFKCNFPLI